MSADGRERDPSTWPGTEHEIAAQLVACLHSPETQGVALGLGGRALSLLLGDARSRRMFDGIEYPYPRTWPALAGLRLLGHTGRHPMSEGGLLRALGAQPTRPEHLSIFHFGSAPGVGGRALAQWSDEHPWLQPLGVRPIQDEFWGPESQKAVGAILKAKPQILIVAVGPRLALEWVHAHRAILDVPIILAT